jgi:YYY domain-containing protein
METAYAAIWWLVLFVLGLIAFPLVSRVCDRLPDKGYAISKIIALLLVAYVSWILASIKLVKFGYVNVLIALLLLAALSLLLRRKDLSLRELPWKPMLVSEGVFVVAFGLFLFILSHKPDLYLIWSEDFMDFGFLNSILRTDYFPPADPWLAGESIPYYYGGHLLSAVMTIITRVPPAIAYNLAVAMFFALAVCAAFGLGYGLTRRKLYGLVTVIFVCLAGFISGAFQLSAFALDQSVAGYTPLDAPNLGEWFLSFDFVTANRIIPDVVTHYPYYAFMVGDLHANVMDIPLQLAFITLVLALFSRRHEAQPGDRLYWLLSVFILGLTLGSLTFINTWSYPAYLLFFLLASLALRMGISKKAIVSVVGLSILLYLPYFLSRGAGGIRGVGFVDNRTDLVEFFEIFALFLVAIFSLLLVLRGRRLFGSRTVALGGIIMMGGVALIAFLMDFQLLLVLAPLVLGSLYYVYRAFPREETEFVLLLVVTGALVVLVWEVLYIDDPLGPPNERYNTILKVYMSVWVLLGAASAYAVFAILARLGRRVKAAWITVLILFIVAAMIHPLATTTSWASGRHSLVEGQRLTLDGMAYLESTHGGDREAIQWLYENVEGSHVVLEAPGTVYEYSSRVSAFTGLPTLIGWGGWEVMWRGGDLWGTVTERSEATDTIYRTTDEEEAGALLAEYNVEYVYVGTIEEERYEPEGLQKFAGHPDRYELVYENPDVMIFKVIDR